MDEETTDRQRVDKAKSEIERIIFNLQNETSLNVYSVDIDIVRSDVWSVYKSMTVPFFDAKCEITFN